MYAYCSQFPNADRVSCIRGAIETSVGETEAMEFGRELCSLETNREQRAECFAFYGEQLEWAKGIEYRKDSCERLYALDHVACLVNTLNEP
jgi:hypothetical protein